MAPLGKQTGWLEARELVRDSRGLPSNALHDELLVHGELWRILKRDGYYPAWASQVAVYPRPNGVFTRGKDVRDVLLDDAGRQWVFPGSQIPEEAIGIGNAALAVDPQQVEVSKGKVVILASAEAIKVLVHFMQDDGWGRVDPETRFPLEDGSSPRPGMMDQFRYFGRIAGEGVRPLARYDGDDMAHRRFVDAGRAHDSRLGVAMTIKFPDEAGVMWR
ncbi:MAG: hypothetical protein KGH72_04605 [Candidatus Micrarchaeota archaeon]|nr:hypothetical protein [Candidatus Micrarchaeota archaeon]